MLCIIGAFNWVLGMDEEACADCGCKYSNGKT